MSDKNKNILHVIDLGIEKYGSIAELARVSKVNRSTLTRIRQGRKRSPHSATIIKLVSVVYA